MLARSLLLPAAMAVLCSCGPPPRGIWPPSAPATVRNDNKKGGGRVAPARAAEIKTSGGVWRAFGGPPVGERPPPPMGPVPGGQAPPPMGPVPGGQAPPPAVDGNSVDVQLTDADGSCSTFKSYARATPTVWDLLGQNNYDALANGVVAVMRRRACRQAPVPPMGEGDGTCPSTGGKCDDGRTRIQSVYVERVLRVNGYTGRLVVTNGIPDHCYQVEAPLRNPNDACEHYSAMWLPLKSTYTGEFADWGLGAVGISISGAYFYNHMSAGGECTVAALTEKPTFDPCDGHADPVCRYHYHKAPVCIDGWQTCGLLGYLVDGVPVYGKCTVRTQSGRTVPMTSSYKLTSGSGCDASHYTHNANSGALDRANGYYFGEDANSTSGVSSFKKGDYAYFFTPEYPFIMPGSMAGGNAYFCDFYPNDLTDIKQNRFGK